MPGARDREGGNMLVVEALVLALLLVAAFLVLEPGTGPRSAGSRGAQEDVADALQDLLAFLEAAPDATGRYASLLERLAGEALQGNTSALETWLGKALPPGAEANAFLDNGHGALALLDAGPPQGEAVTASRLWSPAWEPILALPALRLLDGQNSSLEVQAVPVHRGLGLGREPGVRAEVEFELPGGGKAQRAAFAPLANRSSEGPGVALAFLDEAGSMVYVVRPADGNHSLYLAVEETQGRAAPAGTKLEVRLPPGFRWVEVPAEENPGWSALRVSGNTTYGWTVTAELGSDLSGARRLLRLNATEPEWGKLHLVEARFGGGEHGQLLGLYVSPSNATRSAMLPPGRGPFLSLPGLAPWSAEAGAGLVLAYPEPLKRTLTVTRVTLTAQGGASLAAATGTEPATGWALRGDTLEWTGRRSLAADEALEFRFTLRADAPPRQGAGSASRDGVGLDLRNGYTLATWRQAEAGVFAARLAPRNASAQGFVASAGEHEADLDAHHEGADLAGKLAYEHAATSLLKAMASDLGRGLEESWLEVATPRPALGGSASVAWSLTRVLEELGLAAGQDFKCYTSEDGAFTWTADRAACDALSPPPLDWQVADEAPEVELRVLHPAPALPAWPLAGTRVVAAEGSAALDVPVGSMLGTHVVELRLDFRIQGPGADPEYALQRVSLLGTYEVHPPGRDAGAAPIYSFVVQAWLPDWA